MTESAAIQLLAKAAAKGAMAELQGIIDLLDRDAARCIHADLTRILGQISRKHGFQLADKRKTPERV